MAVEIEGYLGFKAGVEIDGSDVPDYSMGIGLSGRWLLDLSSPIEYSADWLPDYGMGIKLFRGLLDLSEAVEISGS